MIYNYRVSCLTERFYMNGKYVIPEWIIEQAISVCNCFADDFIGMTLREIFADCENMGATVYWGMYDDCKLQTVYEQDTQHENIKKNS